MRELSKEDVKLIDAVLEKLWTGSSEHVISYNILKAHFPQYLNDNNEGEIKRLFTSLELCDVLPLHTSFKLTSFGIKIMGQYFSYSKYLLHLEVLKKRENEMYNNSKNSLTLSKKAFLWNVWNTIFVIIGVVLAAILLYYTISTK